MIHQNHGYIKRDLWEEYVRSDSWYVYIKNNNIYLPEDSSYFFSSQNLKSMWDEGISTVIGLENLNTSLVKDMSYMFYDMGYMGGHNTIDISMWDTSNVENMSHMFGSSNKHINKLANGNPNKLVAIKMNNINTSKVKDMSYMFENCVNLLRSSNR